MRTKIKQYYEKNNEVDKKYQTLKIILYIKFFSMIFNNILKSSFSFEVRTIVCGLFHKVNYRI